MIRNRLYRNYKKGKKDTKVMKVKKKSLLYSACTIPSESTKHNVFSIKLQSAILEI